MIVGVPKESYPGERRVALVPLVVPNLTKAGMEVIVEAGAGEQAGYPDAAYVDKGAKIVGDEPRFSAVPISLCRCCVMAPTTSPGKPTFPFIRRGQALIGFLRPFGSGEVVQQIAHAGVTAFSVELMPRTTRAQSMDALSSMATICGYKAVLLAADTLAAHFPHADHGGGNDHARRVSSSSARASPDCRRSPPRGGWAPWRRPTTCARPPRSRCRASADDSSNCPSKRKDAQDARGYGTAQDETLLRATARAAGPRGGARATS